MNNIIKKVKEWFAGRENLKKASVNTVWQMIDQTVRLIVGFLVGAWFARYIEPEGYGVFGYAKTIAIMALPLATIGLDNILLRELVDRPKDKYKLLGTSFIIRAITGSISYLLVVLYIFLVANEDPQIKNFILVAALILPFQVFEVLKIWFMSQLKSSKFVVAKLLPFITLNILKIVLIVTGMSLIYFIAVELLEYLLGAILLIYFFHSDGNNILKTKFDYKDAGFLLKESFPLFLSVICITIYMRVGTIFVERSFNNMTLGYYQATTRLVELFNFIPMAIVGAVVPVLIRFKQENFNSYIKNLKFTYSILWWLGIITSLFVFFLSKYIVLIAYGSEYLFSSHLLALGIWTFVPTCIGTLSSNQLYMEHKSKWALFQTVISAVLSVALNIILIPHIGIWGVIWATLFAYFISTFSIVLVKECRDQFWAIIDSLNPIYILNKFREFQAK